MSRGNYFISLTSAESVVATTEYFRNITTVTDVFLARPNDDGGSQSLRVVGDSKMDSEELVSLLEDLPTVRSATVIPLSSPIIKSELAAVREQFAAFNLDTSGITDEELAMFIDAELQEKPTYWLDFTSGKAGEPYRATIILREDHPRFSSNLSTRQPSIDKVAAATGSTNEYTMVRSVKVPDVNLSLPSLSTTKAQRMSDGQLREWLRKNWYHQLQDKDVNVERLDKEIKVTAKLSETETETLIFNSLGKSKMSNRRR